MILITLMRQKPLARSKSKEYSAATGADFVYEKRDLGELLKEVIYRKSLNHHESQDPQKRLHVTTQNLL